MFLLCRPPAVRRRDLSSTKTEESIIDGSENSKSRKSLTCDSVRFNEDDGTRTRNHRIDSPLIADSKSIARKQIAKTEANGRSAGRSDKASEGGVADAELAALVAAWPTLSEPIKAAIRALIGSVGR